MMQPPPAGTCNAIGVIKYEHRQHGTKSGRLEQRWIVGKSQVAPEPQDTGHGGASSGSFSLDWQIDFSAMRPASIDPSGA